MKIFAIVDEFVNREIAYLFCCGGEDNYIEIVDDVDEWDLPFILDHFAREGKRTIPPYWTNRWISQRIVPSDRQNLGAILKANKLDEYDELKLLIIADGRCSQDDCCIKKIDEKDLPEEIKERLKKKIVAVSVDNEKAIMLVSFSNGTTGILDIAKVSSGKDFEKRMISYLRKFSYASVKCHGACVDFSQGMEFTTSEVAENINELPFSTEMLDEYAKSRFVSTSEAMEILGCSRQNIDDLVKRGRLNVVEGFKINSKMLYRHEVLSLL